MATRTTTDGLYKISLHLIEYLMDGDKVWVNFDPDLLDSDDDETDCFNTNILSSATVDSYFQYEPINDDVALMCNIDLDDGSHWREYLDTFSNIYLELTPEVVTSFKARIDSAIQAKQDSITAILFDIDELFNTWGEINAATVSAKPA